MVVLLPSKEFEKRRRELKYSALHLITMCVVLRNVSEFKDLYEITVWLLLLSLAVYERLSKCIYDLI